MNEEKKEVKEMNSNKENKKLKSIKDEFGNYLTVYDLLKSMFAHIYGKPDCKGAKIDDDSFRDDKLMRHEIGWKCSKCGESWKIHIRRLRTTISDTRIKEFGGYTYMASMSDLIKVLGKK